MEKIYIKNMVCRRCIMTVQDDLRQLGIPFTNVELGVVHLSDPINKDEREKLSQILQDQGFELLQDKNAALVEKIKTTIIELIHYSSDHPDLNYSTILAEKVYHDYNYLSTLFSSVEAITIERFIILQKIEKIKELLSYNELNLSEIAFQMNYSSVQYLSNQFKREIGITPSQFRKLKINERKPLDSLK